MRSPAYLPVAQLDSASDSDSEGHEFESHRVGQSRASTRNPRTEVLFLIYVITREKRQCPQAARGALQKESRRFRRASTRNPRTEVLFLFTLSHAKSGNAPKPQGAHCINAQSFFRELLCETHLSIPRYFLPNLM